MGTTVGNAGNPASLGAATARLGGRRLLLGVTGCIAAYKVPELARRLRAEGAEVRVIISGGGAKFVTPETMRAVSGHKALLDGEAPVTDDGMDHIALAKWCDAMLICPASANTLAKLSHGMADSVIAATALATAAPVMVAPAMNRNMWLHPATAANVVRLRERGVIFAGPAIGAQACGDHGPGRMLEPSELLQCAKGLFSNKLLLGKRVMVTAGATREPIDPVRYISNRSSGLMGCAVATAAREAGAEVLLVSAATSHEVSDSVQVRPVATAEQMRQAVLQEVSRQDIYIGAAAVSDYRCQEPMPGKIKREAQPSPSIQLRSNPDIIAELGTMSRRPFLVGFAAETDDLVGNARNKLQRKGLDMVVANKVGTDTGFGDVENELLVIWADGMTSIGKARKRKLADELIPVIASRYKEARHANKNH